MSMNWLEGMGHQMDPMTEPGRPTATPVFAGQKLVVVGGMQDAPAGVGQPASGSADS
jgi:hypothetical protein